MKGQGGQKLDKACKTYQWKQSDKTPNRIQARPIKYKQD